MRALIRYGLAFVALLLIWELGSIALGQAAWGRLRSLKA